MIRLVLLVLLLQAGDTKTPLPENAVKYGPTLVEAQSKLWPDLTMPETLGGQIEQETCWSLTSKMCWNPRTELKTDREYGFGLGQITITKSFNVFNELKTSDSRLKDWKWEDRYDPAMQIHALLVKNLQGYRFVTWADQDKERLAFSFAAYNGGMGGVLSDRRVCSATPGCDQSKWFGNVEKTSLKAKTAVAGYGQSFFQINRDYVRNIVIVRSPKYAILWKKPEPPPEPKKMSCTDCHSVQPTGQSPGVR